MKRKNKDNQFPFPAKRKISEMVWEFAGDFIRLGNTQGQKETRLIAASSAWNIACNQPEQRRKLLDDYMAGYLRFNLIPIPPMLPPSAATWRSWSRES